MDRSTPFPAARRLGSPLRVTEPSPAEVDALLAEREALPLAYPQPGFTRDDLATFQRWSIGAFADRQRGGVGSGRADFEAAVAAVHAWTMFDLGWCRRHEPVPLVEEGTVMAFVSRQLGMWTVGVSRVVYTVDRRSDDAWVSGFAYGTLPGHVVAGEERFLVRWDRATDEVSFGIRKASRPAHPLVRLAGPLGTAVQRRFSRQAIDRIRQAVEEAR